MPIQKYKISATKSQKKYTIIVSTTSEYEAKEKLHKDGYSVLSISGVDDSQISWKKFLFQVEKDGVIQSGAIFWDDILKVYIKLRRELEYRVLSLYPEKDSEKLDAKKREEILSKLEIGYKLQQEKQVSKKQEQQASEQFYAQKQLQKTSQWVEKVIKKIESLLANTNNISQTKREKLEQVYEKLIHMKWSSNIIKLQEISELALSKIGEIEVQMLQDQKIRHAKDFLSETNNLLKEFGSSKYFLDPSKDYKKIFIDTISQFFQSFSQKKDASRQDAAQQKKAGEKIDTHSYSYLKTVLLLNTYKKKLKENTKQIYRNPFVYFSPFIKTEEKEKFFIKRKVLQQNISLLSAKKMGRVSSYTSAKKWIIKVRENIQQSSFFTAKVLYMALCIFCMFFLTIHTLEVFELVHFDISGEMFRYILFSIVLYYVFSSCKNYFSCIGSLSFFVIVWVFFQVNL